MGNSRVHVQAHAAIGRPRWLLKRRADRVVGGWTGPLAAHVVTAHVVMAHVVMAYRYSYKLYSYGHM